MKRAGAVVCVLLVTISLSYTQEIPYNTEQQLEQLTDLTESEPEDDAWLATLEHYRKNPVNLNTAGQEELTGLQLLNAIQVANLVAYRKLFGMLASIYELQAVPAWDPVTIRKILPYITVAVPVTIRSVTGARLRNGTYNLLFRVSSTLEKSNRYRGDHNGPVYPGSPDRIYFRYQYNYRNLFQYGLLGDKDAGERFFGGVQKMGFDFYSFHVFARKVGKIQSLAVGDFTVNMGQGLIQWQTMAFKKSAEITGIKRQSPVLRPYLSPGEFNFQRGAGVTIKLNRFEATLFASLRKLSANLSGDSGTISISSFLPMGYHRTDAENRERNNVTQFATGGNVTYRHNRFDAGINLVRYSFSYPLQKRDEPYNLFSITGRSWLNASIDYSYTYKNIHFFGEVATCSNLAGAVLNGLLVSAASGVDVSIVHRLISPRYQALYGNAFTENSLPTNESGIFGGIDIRAAGGLRVTAYAELFRFPWLRYNVDGPSGGREYLVQLQYHPNRQVEVYTRYRIESKQKNASGAGLPVPGLVTIPRKGWRTHLSCQLNTDLVFRTRAEFVWYNNKDSGQSRGSLLFADLLFKPKMKPWAGAIRLAYFETDDYNARIYAYEQDVAYSFSIPALSGKGHRYYLSLNYDPAPRWSAWLRFSQTIYTSQTSIGSGPDQFPGNRKSEYRFQVRWLMQQK